MATHSDEDPSRLGVSLRVDRDLYGEIAERFWANLVDKAAAEAGNAGRHVTREIRRDVNHQRWYEFVDEYGGGYRDVDDDSWTHALMRLFVDTTKTP